MRAKRDPWLDNAKMLLIAAVVVGHVLAILPGDDPFRDHLYAAIYVVHMPAFVLVSGYLSQRFSYTRRHLTSLVTTLVVPYVIFTLIMHTMFESHVGRPVDEPMFLDPFWALWFLAALLLWRLASPVLRSTPAMIPLAVLVALVIPMVDQTPELALNRALQFLPYFVIGLHLKQSSLEQLKRPTARILSVLALASLWWVTGSTDERFGDNWLFSNHSYRSLGVDTSEGIILRVSLIALALIGSFALLSLTPTKGGWWTTIGTQSMTVYLGHTVAVQALQYDGYFRDLDPTTATWHGLVAAALIVGVLSAPPVVRSLRWVTDPVGAVQALRLDLKKRKVPTTPATAPERELVTAG